MYRLNRLPFQLLAVLAIASPSVVESTDTLWKVISDGTHQYEVHVVSDGALGSGFPNRPLYRQYDQGLLTDIYVVNQSIGVATEVPKAMHLISLVQSSFKNPSNPGAGLSPEPAISSSDLDNVGVSYGLYTSHFFSSFYQNTFLLNGAEGLNNEAKRAQLYRVLFFDLMFQPDMLDGPSRENQYQMVVDLMTDVDEVHGALGTWIGRFNKASEINGEIPWSSFKGAVHAMKDQVRHVFDIHYVPPDSTTSLSKFADAVDVVSEVTSITAACARELLLYSLAQERAIVRADILEDFLARAQAAGYVDPAIISGFAMAQADVNEYSQQWNDNLHDVIISAILDSGDTTLRLTKLSKAAVKVFWGKSAAASFGHVALPYVLSYETFQGIRKHADTSRMASLAATLQRKLFASYGLEHHRDAMHVSYGLDGVEAQAFCELYQMNWYLAARHYKDTVWSLNNRLSWIWGLGIDIILPGTPYDEQMDDLKRSQSQKRMIAQRMVPTAYLAGTQDPNVPTPQSSEFDWFSQRTRDYIVASPSSDPPKDLGVCVTLPWDPSGTPAVEGVNIRFEPRRCSDPSWTIPWECSSSDPDGDCSARVGLFWDNDRNSSNADCETLESGPCPIPGAQGLHPERGTYVWEPLQDGLERGDYYVRAVITDGDLSYETYSDGHYIFVDPLFEGDAWEIVDVSVREDSPVSDGDGIPELGETVEVEVSIENVSGRPLDRVKGFRLTLEGEPVRHQITDDWDSSNPDDLEVTYILDDDVLFPDAGVGQTVTASDEFDLYIGSLSSTSIRLILWIGYWDDNNPVDPEYRRIQEVALDFQVSDGSEVPFFNCSGTTLVGDSDGDGVFESGESGHFTATLCNSGSWEAIDVRGTFESPPPQGEWDDEDSGYPDISVGDCETSNDDFDLDLDLTECGTYSLPMTVTYGEGQSQSGVLCQISATCVPWQSIRDDADLGVVPQGDPVNTLIPIYNRGAATLAISSVVEQSGFSDTQINSYPASLAPGTSGDVSVTIDTTSIDPGRYDRTIVVTSNANNTDERESIIYFGVTGGGAAQQITVNGINSEPDLFGGIATYERGREIYYIDVNSKVETRVTNTAEDEYSPRIWGRRITFTRRDSATDMNNVFLYDLDTGVETQLTNIAAHQSHPDIYDDVVVWEDDRAGDINADIYQYRIGVSSMNGELLVDLGSRYAADEPRIEEHYVVYGIHHFYDPANNGAYYDDLGYLKRSNSQKYSLGLMDDDPCDQGSMYDVYDYHLAFECDCDDACDRDDQIYYVNMDTHSAPTRLTCVPDLDDREEPVVFDDRVLYTLDGDDDIYQVAIGNGCQTEVPLHVGPAVMKSPGGDPRTDAYVFHSNEVDGTQLWGVIPPPPVDIAIESFDFDITSCVQGASYDYHIEVRNQGTESSAAFDVAVSDSIFTFGSHSVSGGLAPGELRTLDGSWVVPATTTGTETITAGLSPAPPGDGNATNDSKSVDVNVNDDDTNPPVISAETVSPGPGDDSDPYIELGESITVQWTATDPAGVAETSATCSGSPIPGTPQGGGVYQAVHTPVSTGAHSCQIVAQDADDSPETSDPTIVGYSVFTPAPVVSGTSPLSGSTGVDPRASVSATFDVDMNPATITANTALLEDPTIGQIVATVSYSAGTRSLTLVPDQSLEAYTAYTVTIVGGAAGVRDVRDNPMATSYQWGFTTGEVVDPASIIFIDGFESGSPGEWSSTTP
jgi:beta propeller repeat protein